jgi:helicase
VLPLGLASGFAQLLRDFLSLDPTDRLLARWRPLDHLIVLELLFDRRPKLRRFSPALVGQLDAWMRNVRGHDSLLHEEWIAGSRGTSGAGEVLGSLRIRPAPMMGAGDEWAHKGAYSAILQAVILYGLGQGVSADELERRWSITGLGGAEERWRDERLWLLAGLTEILDLRCFYFHLRKECDADGERVKQSRSCCVGCVRKSSSFKSGSNTVRPSVRLSAISGAPNPPTCRPSVSNLFDGWKRPASEASMILLLSRLMTWFDWAFGGT